MNNEIGIMYQINQKQQPIHNSDAELKQLPICFKKANLHHHSSSKNSIASQDDQQNLNSRSQSRNSNRNGFNQVLSEDFEKKQNNNSMAMQWPLKQNLQIRKSVSSKVIRMSTSQFSKRSEAQQEQKREGFSSDPKNAYLIQDIQKSATKFSQYFNITSRSIQSNQAQAHSPNQDQRQLQQAYQSNMSQRQLKNEKGNLYLPPQFTPMSLQYKKFQESYFQNPKTLAYMNNFSQIPYHQSRPSSNNSTFNNNLPVHQKNSSSNLLQKYFSNQSTNQIQQLNQPHNSSHRENNNTLSIYDHDDVSTQYANFSTEFNQQQNSPYSRLASTQLPSNMVGQNHHSPIGVGTTRNSANSILTKMSFPNSPPQQQPFFITENPIESNLQQQFSLQDEINTNINEVSYQKRVQGSQAVSKTITANLLKQKSFQNKFDFTKPRASVYYSPTGQSSLSQRKSLQHQFEKEQQNILDLEEYDSKSSTHNEKQTQQSYFPDEAEKESTPDSQNLQNSEEKSDETYSFNPNFLLQNKKDKVYYERIMTPISSKSEIQKDRLESSKPKLKFYQKLKNIEKIQEQNEFDRVKIRNTDLETVVIQNQLRNYVLPINLNKCYKENKIPIKVKSNPKKKGATITIESQDKPQDNVSEFAYQQGEQLTGESQQDPSILPEKTNSNFESEQKRMVGVNYQGLQDEEKIKEMEEFLESDKYNETLYANNLKMGQPYLDIITNILNQKKARRSLKQVFVKNNRISNDSLAKIVQNLPLSTRQLDISCNQINHIGSKYVTELLLDNAFHNLEYLNVSNNMIGDIGTIKIFEAAVSNNFLKILDLSFNRITNLCNKHITKLLKSNQYLDELYLGHNTLMNESLKAICEGLINNYNLKVLDLQNNSLGGGNDPSKFFGKKLIRICGDKHSNMKHLDLSHNRFQKNEAVEIAAELKDNFYIYGLHFEGNPCNFIVNARGFLVENKKKFEEQGRGIFQRNIRINDSQNISEIYKEYYYKTLNVSSEQQSILSSNRVGKPKQKLANMNERQSCTSGEVCWICDEYQEIKFTFKLNYKIDREPIYIHLSFEAYEPFRMEQDPHDNMKFFIYRMCPVDTQITYFFSNPFINQISILPYNQIRSETNPMTAQPHNQKRQSIKANVFPIKNTDTPKEAIAKTIVVDYTDIKNYIIPLPYLMNILKQTNNKADRQNQSDNTPKNNIEGSGNELPDSAEEFVKQVHNQGQKKKEEYQTHINKDEFDKNPQGEIIYMYKKKLSNVLNDNYDPVIRSIIRQIQKPYLEQAGQAKGWKKNGWDIKNSVFAEYKGDDYQHLKNCFEFDWSQSKLTKMVRSNDDKEELKQVIDDIYPYMKSAYKYLSCQNIYGDVFGISYQVFLDFLTQSKIIDGKLIKSSDIEFNFIATNAQKDKHPRNPDKALIRFQFMELLVRLAFDKYIKNKTFSNFSDAFKQVLNEEDLLKVLMSYNDPQQWRESKLWTPQCDVLVKQKIDFFKKIYEKWAGSRNKEKRLFTNTKTMSCQEFKDFINSYSVFSDLTNDRELNQFFSDSIMTQIDELNKDRHMQMVLIEFIEAFGRVSDKISPVPNGEDKDAYTKEELIQLPLHMKMESIIAQIDGKQGAFIALPKAQSRQSLLNIPQKELSMPKINSQNVLDQKSIEEIKDDDINQNNNNGQIKLGFKGFMLAKSLKKRLIENKINSIQPHAATKREIIENKKSLENINEV